MKLILYLLYYVSLRVFVAANDNEIRGKFSVGFCSARLSHCDGKDYNRHISWIRFQPLLETEEVFWLKIKRKETDGYPIIVKSGSSTSYNISTAAPSADCHCLAGSILRARRLDDSPQARRLTDNPLWTHKLTDTPDRGDLPLDGDISDNVTLSPISLCDGVSGIVGLAGGDALVRIEPSDVGDRRIVTLVQIPRLSTEDMEQLNEYPQWKRAAGGAVRRGLKRVKRSFRMPVQSPPGPFLVELYVIVDSKMASMYAKNNYSKLIARIKSIMNQINLAFMQFNIYFAVVQMEIWEQDPIKFTDKNHILNDLQLYKRQNIDKKHDCLHAFLGENRGSKRRGESEPASMCTFSSCVAYTKDYWGLKELEIAHAAMHEIGHNFGLSHDTERCQCFGCIMATGVEFGNRKFQWSNCSRKQMPDLLASGMADCLRDGGLSEVGDFRPIVRSQNRMSHSLAEVSLSQCGNGVVDDGEECDCGGRLLCSASASTCCDAATCRLRSGARCASGACCDLASCSLRRSGFVCRATGSRDCDLPEYCNGVSEWCPADVHKIDGVPCTAFGTGESSHCYHGECHSRGSWCKVLFGGTATEASRKCYDRNRVGDAIRNCGLEVPEKEERDRRVDKWSPRLCSESNARCGRLWCSHENERVLRLSPQLEADEMVEGCQCSAARFDLDWYLDDAGLVPNGSPCGYGKMCWHGDCVQSASVDTGGCHCHGHGVCNNRGHCHCDRGFSPPNCTDLGDGGSQDSGPPMKFHHLTTVVVASVLVVFVLLVTALLILILLYHYNTRRWPPIFAKIGFPGYRKAYSAEETKFENNHSKPVRSALHQLVINDNIEDNTCRPLWRSSSPVARVQCDEAVGDRGPAPNNASKRLSPTMVKNAKKPSSVKQRANQFDRQGHLTASTLVKAPPKVPPHPPAKAVNKPKTYTNVAKAVRVHESESNKTSPPPRATLRHQQPPRRALPPRKSPSEDAITDTVTPRRDLLRKPPILSNKPPKSLSEDVIPRTVGSAGDPSRKPPILSNKPRQSLADDDNPNTMESAGAPSRKLAVVSNKPQKVPLTPAISTNTAEDSPVNANIAHPLNLKNRHDLARPSQKPLVRENSAASSKTAKERISQPRLEQTTCTATTRDLANPDQTLSRTVAPHKVLRPDPSRAVKYLY